LSTQLRENQLWIFDMDGTLLESGPLAVPAFQETQVRMRQAGWDVPAEDWTEQQIVSTFGWTHDHIWQQLLGYRLTEEQQRKADEWVLQGELDGLRVGRVSLFAGVEDTLRELHRTGALLAVASNGQQGYIEGIIEVCGLSELFSGLYSAAGRKTATKVELVRQLLAEIPADQAVMVGDRSSDIEAGKGNGLPSIGCAFGFAHPSELAHADYQISHFSELLAIDPWPR